MVIIPQRFLTSGTCVLLLWTLVAFQGVHGEFNETLGDESQLLHRMKRFLIFNNGGIMKNLLGIVMPVQFGDNSKRSLNLGYNFQSQYSLPPLPIDIFKAPFFTGFSRSGRSTEAPKPDDSREFMYNTLERIWDRRGRDGRECLLRAICEVAESPFAHSGMFGEIVDAIFTPHSEDEAMGEGSEFYQARQAGLNHADCEKTYWKCPQGEGFLDSISHFFD